MKRTISILIAILIAIVFNGTANATVIDTTQQEDENAYAFHGISFEAVTQRELNLRDDEGEVIELLPSGTQLHVFGVSDKDNTRCVVLYHGEKADIVGTVWLKFLEPAPEQKYNYAFVKSEVGLNQRDKKKKLIDFLDYGTVVSVAEEEDINGSSKRVKVKSQKEGYVLREGLEGTFVLVDISDQVLYYIQNQKLVVFGPCVTGNISKDMNTPAGVYEILSRQKDFKMKGRYQTNYAFRYYEGYFLHDAPWRGEKENFGGDTYEYSGSHGCINLPTDVAQSLWEGDEHFSYLLEGTAVVVQK